MLIDEKKLVALLVEKTDWSPNEVQEKLEQLKELIKEVAASGEEFEINTFGVFCRRNGNLYFEPSDQLKTEINQKYVGMRPIELMEAFKETGAGVPVEEPPGEQEVADSKKDEGSDESIPVTEAEEFETELQDQPEVLADEEKKKEKEPATVSAAKEEAAAGSPKKKAFSKAGLHRNRRKNGSLGRTAVVVILGIVILIAGGLVYYSGVLDRPDAGNEANVPADTLNRQRTKTFASGDSAGNTGSADTTEQNVKANVSSDSTNEKSSVSAKYGLKGTINVQVEKAYTIVIHSFRLKSTIKPIADSLHQQGYRTILFRRSDISRWRLGLGQFKTIKDAQKAAQTLSNPYKQNHFITHI